MASQQDFLRCLEEERKSFMHRLTSMLGDVDESFMFGEIRPGKTEDESPHTDLPYCSFEGGQCVRCPATKCTVDIVIGKRAIEESDWQRATWQLAHECVHLLDPGPRLGTKFLEEGLASWFQSEPSSYSTRIDDYIAKSKSVEERTATGRRYKRARNAVEEVMERAPLLSIVKHLRSPERRLREITEEDLRSRIAEQSSSVHDELVILLCEDFYDPIE